MLFQSAMGVLRSASFFYISTLFFAQIYLVSTSGLNQSVILVSFDGLGWEFVGSKRANTPNFDFFVSGGVKAKNLIGVHPSKTFPSHTTFLTGLYPESHGIVDNKFWDPLYMEKFILEHDCSNFDPKFYNDSEPIWLTMQKQGMNTGAYYWPGSTSYSEKPTFYPEPFCYLKCEDYKGPRLQFLRLYLKAHCFFDWAKSFQKRIDTVLEWLVSENPPRLVMLYFEQPDEAGHKNGPNSATYVKKIEDIDKEVLGYLVEKLMRHQLMDKTNVILLSDHGMIETRDTRQIRIHDYVEPESYFRNIASPEHIWPKPGKLEEIYAKLKSSENPHLKVYKKEEIPEEYHWKNNRRIPPIYLVAEEGWLMRQDYNPLAEGKWVEGTHGWPPTENSAGIFYARGPAFKEGYASNKSKRAIDVYAMLCYLVGAKPLPNNGSLDNMVEFLKKTPASNDERKRGTSITSHTVFTPTITNPTPRISSQTKTGHNQWHTKGYQTEQDTTTIPTPSSFPFDQRATNKEQKQPSRGFFLPDQHLTEVNGNSLDHKSRSNPQRSIKITPTETQIITNQLQQTSVSPQAYNISAKGATMSAMDSLDANTTLTHGIKKRKATDINEKDKEKTKAISLHANARLTYKEDATLITPYKILTSEMSFRSSNSIHTNLILTSSLTIVEAKPDAVSTRTLKALTDSKNSKSKPALLETHVPTSDLQSINTASTVTTLKDAVWTRTLRLSKDSKNSKSTPVLLDTPILTSDLQHFITTSTLTDSFNPTPTVVEIPVNTLKINETLSDQQSFSAPVDSPISSNDVKRLLTSAMLTTSTESYSPSSTLVNTTMTNTDANGHSFVLPKSIQKTPDPLHNPLWNSDSQSVVSTTTLKTSTEIKKLQIASLGAPKLFVSTTTSTQITKMHFRTSLVPTEANRENFKMVSEEKELILETTTPNTFVSATLTEHYELANASVDDAKHENTVTRTAKEQLSQTTNGDILVEWSTTSLHQYQVSNIGVVAKTTQKPLSVLIASSIQVQPSAVSSSSVIRTNNITSNFTRNNISTDASNSSTSNETISERPDEDGVNTEALIDCPPFEEEENDDQSNEYSGNHNAKSSARANTKLFLCSEIVLILMIVNLNAWLCLQ